MKLVRLAAALLVVALAACGGSSDDARSVRLEMAVGDPARSDVALAAPRGPLDPGSYVTGIFRPTLSFAVDASWNLYAETPVSVDLYTEEADDKYAGVTVLDVRRSKLRIIDPPHVSSGYNRSDLFEVSRPLTGDYLDWLRSQPALDVGEEVRTALGRLRGRRVPAVVARTPDGVCGGVPGACVVLVLASADSQVSTFRRGDRIDASILDGPTGPLLVLVYGRQLGLDRVDPVLESLRFGGSDR